MDIGTDIGTGVGTGGDGPDGAAVTTDLPARPSSAGRGRPSLTGERVASPQVTFRLAPELRARADAEAARQGRLLSDLAREALERYLAP